MQLDLYGAPKCEVVPNRGSKRSMWTPEERRASMLAADDERQARGAMVAAWRRWAAWCESRAIDALPPQPHQVLAWIAAEAELEGYPTTLWASVHALRAAAEKQGHADPFASVEHDKHTKQCPRCELTAQGEEVIGQLFGYRTMRGRRVPQPWCKKCRTEASRESRLRARAARQTQAAIDVG